MTAEKRRFAPDLTAVAVLGVVATALSGQYATTPNLLPWYAELIKPAFGPPNWVFAPVWSALYLLMIVGAWRIARKPASPARSIALKLFFIQLALNAAWSWMFFAAHSPLLGLVNIVAQEAAVIATLIAFRRLDAIAGWCLAPLPVWVAFATVLNAAIWWLNG